jgi:hypothetical protein
VPGAVQAFRRREEVVVVMDRMKGIVMAAKSQKDGKEVKRRE